MIKCFTIFCVGPIIVGSCSDAWHKWHTPSVSHHTISYNVWFLHNIYMTKMTCQWALSIYVVWLFTLNNTHSNSGFVVSGIFPWVTTHGGCSDRRRQGQFPPAQASEQLCRPLIRLRSARRPGHRRWRLLCPKLRIWCPSRTRHQRRRFPTPALKTLLQCSQRWRRWWWF